MQMQEEKNSVIAVVGPTASGKSDIAVKLAHAFDGEVVSADARQVYRGLDIGTGKITREEMQGVPHHLLDIADPSEVITAKEFASRAQEKIAGIHARGKLPILAGGSGFYLAAALGEMKLPDVAPNYELRKHLETKSAEELMQELRARDNERADRIDLHNRRRIIRAIEIHEALGYIPDETRHNSPYDVFKIGITLSREELKKKIHARLLRRIEEGMIEEAHRLHENGLSYARMEELGLEYRFLARFLKGELTKEAMAAQLEVAINQYAKRQMTWLKRDPRIEWFAPDEYEAMKDRVERFLLKK